jgi:hypothetical protein
MRVIGGQNKRDCAEALERYAAGEPFKKILREFKLRSGTFCRHLEVARVREPEKFKPRKRGRKIKES